MGPCNQQPNPLNRFLCRLSVLLAVLLSVPANVTGQTVEVVSEADF